MERQPPMEETSGWCKTSNTVGAYGVTVVDAMWKPILTAPTNGSRIEICQITPSGKVLHAVEVIANDGDSGMPWTWPTHWRPARRK